MLQTTTNAQKARSFFLKYYHPAREQNGASALRMCL